MNKTNEYVTLASQQRDGIHKAYLMDKLTSADNDLLESVLGAIGPEYQPSTIDEGLEKRKGLGFSI